MIRTDKGASPIPQHHGYGTSPMSPREPQHTPPKTLAMNSSRDMLEKLRREIDRLAGSIIRQEIVDHGLNAAMTAWHLTDWVWREIQGSPRRPILTAKARAPIRELKQFQELVKRNCAELAYCEDIAISTKHFTFSKLPVFWFLHGRPCIALCSFLQRRPCYRNWVRRMVRPPPARSWGRRRAVRRVPGSEGSQRAYVSGFAPRADIV